MSLETHIKEAEWVLKQYEQDKVHAARMAVCLAGLIASIREERSEKKDGDGTGNNDRECRED